MTLSEVLRLPHIPSVNLGFVERVSLPGRGRCRVRLVPPPAPGSPVVTLLHGWTATADLNFATVMAPLSERFGIVAPDMRGHGGGIRSHERFSLESCADDVAELLEVLDVGPSILLGYSMGGPIALLAARRHPEAVRGLVLCATAARLGRSNAGRLALGALGAVGMAAQSAMLRVVHQGALPREVIRHLPTPLGHDLTQVAEVGTELARFDARPWLDEIQMPTALVLTRNDHAVPPADQQVLAQGLAGCRLFEVEGDHDVCLSPNPVFESTVCAAVTEVALSSRRSAHRASAG